MFKGKAREKCNNIYISIGREMLITFRALGLRALGFRALEFKALRFRALGFRALGV